MYHERCNMDELREKGKREIGEESESMIPDKIAELKENLQRRDPKLTLHPEAFDDCYLRCIRARKYDINRAAELYLNLNRLRFTRIGQVLLNLQKPTYIWHYEEKIGSVLRNSDDFGRKILLFRSEMWDPETTSFEEAMASMFVILHEMMADEDAQILGIVAIWDLKNFSFAQLKRMRPDSLHTFLKIYQDSYPCRFKEVHIINHPSLLGSLINATKPFLKKKLRERLHFHSSTKSLHEAMSIDPKHLPIFLDGSLSEDKYWDAHILQNLRDKDEYYVQELLSYGFRQSS